MAITFISYSSEDRLFVIKLARDLQDQGHTIWLDQWNITGRKPYWDEIQDGIQTCTHFLFVVSPDSLEQDCGARRELYHAAGLKPTPVIVPIVARFVPYEKFPIHISPGTFQIHDFSVQSYETVFPRVVNALSLESDMEPSIASAETESDQISMEDISISIKKHNEIIVSEHSGDWLERFINLKLNISMTLRPEQRNTVENHTIFELVSMYNDKPIAVLGEPGAGKTTLVKVLIVRYAETEARIPAFLNMSVYSSQSNLVKELSSVISEPACIQLLENGRFLIVFDGLNEVDIRYKRDAVNEIMRLIRQYPNNVYIITCRIAEYPTFLRISDVRRFEVARLDSNMMKRYLNEELGVKLGTTVYHSLSYRLRELCQNPLLLTMLTYLYKGSEEFVGTPTSKAKLYEQFLDELYQREESLRAVECSQRIRDQFIEYIALKMNNDRVSVKREYLEDWVSELYNQRHQVIGVDYDVLLRELLFLPPLKVSAPGQSANISIGFMHQSFQEYYTARYLFKQLEKNEITLQDITQYASPQNEHWWETLSLVVGLLDDATELIRAIKSYGETVANTQRNQKVFTLVARCVREASYISPLEVDDIIIRTLLAFKFGKVAFDFDLILGLKLISPEQRSPDFPDRLADDLAFWLEKWGRVNPVKLGKGIPIKVLLQYLDSSDESLVLDALFTIRDHPERSKITQSLVEKLKQSEGIVREQVVAALGYLGQDAKVAIDLLMDIVKNRDETEWTRAHALGALGHIGDARAVPIMVEYMLDHSNPFRDSASWALQGIAKANMQDSELHTQLKKVYLQALLAEVETRGGRHAKGNIVYSLGELKATEFVEEIIEWLTGQTDPFVIEDGIQTLGQLQDPKAIEIIRENLTNADSVVRMTAVEALSKLASANPDLNIDLASEFQIFGDNEVAIVRESIEKALVQPGGSV